MSELLLPLPSLSLTGCCHCSGGATGISTRGHDNVLLIVWEHQRGKTTLVARVFQLNLSASHVASELSDIAPASFSQRVRPSDVSFIRKLYQI